MTKDFDVKADKPSWPLSSYGPAKNEKNLLPPLDESPEELRFKAVTAIRNGNINEYVRSPTPFGKEIDLMGASFNMSKMDSQMRSKSLLMHATTSKAPSRPPKETVLEPTHSTTRS
jgi:hypothetical protein